jgi:hypothetical protein
MQRMQEKEEQAELEAIKVDESTDEELDPAKAKRYGNGKVKREQKKQTSY